jgi:protein-S-isoprenylcysteine O-methyltransferase Ste14
MNLLFIITYIAWVLSEILLNRILHSKSSDKKNTDKGSLIVLWTTIMVSITVSVFIANNIYLPVLLNPVIQYVGLAMIYIGITIRIIAIVSLGQFFTVDVTIRENHKLKKDGIYKYLRHPSYSGSLLSFIGLGLTMNNWISLLLISLSIIISFIYRISIEEKVLIEQFGSEYTDYQKFTRRIIPYIY